MNALTFRHISRRLLHEYGGLGVLHHWRNGATLTVTMFHRVLQRDSSSWKSADPNYAVSAELFADCLMFFKRYYKIVGLDDVIAARIGQRPLPRHALLITFDDGWADNASVALPLLLREGVPATIFLATDAITDPTPGWWQEDLLRAARLGLLSEKELWGDDRPPGCRDTWQLLRRWAALDAPSRRQALARFAADPVERHMLDDAQIARMSEAGVSLGAHGASHLPLALMADPAGDLKRARATLASLAPAADTTVLSLPHGSASAHVLAQAEKQGFRLVFTSQPCLNEVAGGQISGGVLGRIEMVADQIADAKGRLDPARLAAWLFMRPKRRPGAMRG